MEAVSSPSVSFVPSASSVSRRPRGLVAAREIIREACFGLYHHRFRAALSMLGISWGIISVVVLLSYGDGFRGAIDAGLSADGDGLLSSHISCSLDVHIVENAAGDDRVRWVVSENRSLIQRAGIPRRSFVP